MNLKKSNKPVTEAKQDKFYCTSPKKFMGKCKSRKKEGGRGNRNGANDRKQRGIKQKRIN